MRRLRALALAVCTSLAVMAGGGTPALAEHGTGTDFFRSFQGERLANNLGNEFFCMTSGWGDGLGDFAVENARITTAWAINQIEGDTDLANNYSLESGVCGNINFVQEWNQGGYNGVCNSFPAGARSVVDYENVSSIAGGLAITIHCNTDGDAWTDMWYTVINRGALNSTNTTWDAFCGNCPQPSTYDYAGIIMHELMHGLGVDGGVNVDGHFTEGGGSCPDDNGRQTMCPNANGAFNGFGRPGTWARTLGPHDIGIVNEVY